jgi:hypothetical protein
MNSTIKTFFNSKWHKKIFIYTLYFSYILIFISLTGLFSWAPEYLHKIQKYIIYYICIILIGRFNPFINNHIVFDDYDRQIVYSAGIALLMTTGAIHIFENYIVTAIHKM